MVRRNFLELDMRDNGIDASDMDYFLDNLFEDERKNGSEQVEVTCHTEYKRNSIYVRAHPNYQSRGAIYDWVYCTFTRRQGQNEDVYVLPCRILCLFSHPTTNKKMAIVHSAIEMATENVEERYLVEKYRLEMSPTRRSQDGNFYYVEPILRCVCCDDFVENAIVVCVDNKVKESIEVECSHEKDDWTLDDSVCCYVVLDVKRDWSEMFTKT